MHINIIKPLAYVTALLIEEGLLSVSIACCVQLVKMLITLEPHGGLYLDLFCILFFIVTLPAIGM